MRVYFGIGFLYFIYGGVFCILYVYLSKKIQKTKCFQKSEKPYKSGNFASSGSLVAFFVSEIMPPGIQLSKI